MKITYLGHSCFKLEYNGFTLVIDPYKNGKVPGLADLNESADVVLCSHDHDDHNAAQLISLTGREDTPFDVSVIKTYHDDMRGRKRGINKIHSITAGGYRLVHMGDIGCGLTLSQKKALCNPDVLMVPIGGYYTVNAHQALQLVNDIKPNMVIPMHYRYDNVGFEEIDTAENFLSEFNKSDIYFTGSDYVLNGNKTFFVAVMSPKYKING